MNKDGAGAAGPLEVSRLVPRTTLAKYTDDQATRDNEAQKTTKEVHEASLQEALGLNIDKETKQAEKDEFHSREECGDATELGAIDEADGLLFCKACSEQQADDGLDTGAQKRAADEKMFGSTQGVATPFQSTQAAKAPRARPAWCGALPARRDFLAQWLFVAILLLHRLPCMSSMAVALGGYHTAVLKSDGTVWTAGQGSEGQLGDGGTASRSTFAQVMAGAQAMALGAYHTAALKIDGTVWMAGRGEVGQLGDGGTASRNTFAQVLAGAQAVALGAYHTAVLKSDGTVWMAGMNNGRLGDGGNGERRTFAQVMAGAQAVALGAEHTAALKSDGTVWTTGKGKNGRLGDGGTDNRLTFAQVLAGAEAVALGSWHTAVLKIDGTVWMAGAGGSGQLGDGGKADRTTFAQVMAGVQAVALGYDHTAVLKSDGTVWTTGEGWTGQLGDGGTASRSTFAQVLSGAQAVALGWQYTAALKSDGTVWTTGEGNNGRLGDGGTASRSTFAQVQTLEVAPTPEAGEASSTVLIIAIVAGSGAICIAVCCSAVLARRRCRRDTPKDQGPTADSAAEAEDVECNSMPSSNQIGGQQEAAQSQPPANQADEGHQITSMDFWFIPVENFMKLPDDCPVPRHQELLAMGLLVRRKVSMEDVINGKLAEDTAAVSHRWPTSWHFDPDGKKVRKLKSIFSTLPRAKFIWIDWLCAPQKLQKEDPDGNIVTVSERTLEEKTEFNLILSNILPFIYLGAMVVVIWDREYNRRFWPNVETWVATKMPTASGLKPAASSRMRAAFFGFLSAEGEDGVVRDTLMGHWHERTAESAIQVLSQDDIIVTNMKDKRTNLKVIASLDDHIRELFLAEGAMLDAEDKEFLASQAQLRQKQEEAVSADDFAQAANIKNMIAAAGRQYVAGLKEKKRIAVIDEDFDEATRLHARIQKLSNES